MITYAHWLSVVEFCQNKMVDNEKTASILQSIAPYMGKIPFEHIHEVLDKMYVNYPVGTHKKTDIIALLIDSIAEVVDYATAGTIAVDLLMKGGK